MQIVIDIPEQIYQAAKMFDVEHDDVIQIPLEVIKNGTSLPKGHGRLIDADAFIEKLKDVRKEVCLTWITADELRQEIIETLETSESDAPTIIEADKEDQCNE